jgi:hypothetical protein
MGLDLHHVIPTTQANSASDYFTLKELDSNQNFIAKHLSLITEVCESEWDFQIMIFPDELSMDLVTKSSPHYAGRPKLIGNVDELGDQLNEIAIKYLLHEKERMILKTTDNLLTKEFGKEIYYHSAVYETGSKTIKVLPYLEKGYQRKGMNPAFYDAFENGKLYFNKASVEKASLYLKPASDEHKDEAINHFLVNFVDNFVEGESIFFGTW